MAEPKVKKKRSGRYCVAGGPNNQSCKSSGSDSTISFHKFPKDIRRTLWVRFVQRHRPGWQPSNSSVLCSLHFNPECYEQRPDINLDSSVKTKAWLSKTASPSVDTVNNESYNNTLTTTTPRNFYLNIISLATV